MRRVHWAAALALLTLVPLAVHAQKADRNERRVARLMDELREEMWSYRQELDYFRRAPEYERLVDLRYRLRGQAIRVAELESEGARAQLKQREVAREMEETARDLKQLTGKLEDRTDVAAPAEVRRHADRLKGRADKIRDYIGKLRDVVRN